MRILLVALAICLLVPSMPATAVGVEPSYIKNCKGTTMDPVGWCRVKVAAEDFDGRDTGAEFRIAGKTSFCIDSYCTPWIPFCFGVAVIVSDQPRETRIPCGIL